MCTCDRDLPNSSRYTVVEDPHQAGRYLLTVDTTPKTYFEAISNILKIMKLTEKFAEMGDLSFHLFRPILLKYLNKETYDSLNNLHKGAHHLEHVIHSFCFLTDLAVIFNGKYIERSDHGQKIDVLLTLGKVLHTVSHFFATLTFVKELNLIKLGVIEKIAQYHLILSAASFAIISVATLLKQKEDHTGHNHAPISNESKFELWENISGCVFDTFQCLPDVRGAETISQIAGLFHSYRYITNTPRKEQVLVTLSNHFDMMTGLKPLHTP